MPRLKKKIGDHEYFIRQITADGTVRFPHQLSQQIVENFGLNYGDALGFRITDEREETIIVEVIPLALKLEPKKKEKET